MTTKNIFLATIFISLSSCAYHVGTMSSSAAVSNGHFKVLGYAVGTSEVNKFLGFGGLNKDGLVLEAKKDLYQKYPLDSGQVFGNITVDFKTSVGFPFSKTQVFVGADVIDFYPERNATLKSAAPVQEPAKYEQLNDRAELNGFKIGDTVSATVSGKAVSGTITKFKGNWVYVSQANNKKVWVPVNTINK